MDAEGAVQRVAVSVRGRQGAAGCELRCTPLALNDTGSPVTHDGAVPFRHLLASVYWTLFYVRSQVAAARSWTTLCLLLRGRPGLLPQYTESSIGLGLLVTSES